MYRVKSSLGDKTRACNKRNVSESGLIRLAEAGGWSLTVAGCSFLYCEIVNMWLGRIIKVFTSDRRIDYCQCICSGHLIYLIVGKCCQNNFVFVMLRHQFCLW